MDALLTPIGHGVDEHMVKLAAVVEGIASWRFFDRPP
jgi:hypothetical protein